eukprot:gnl/TRDRNA2_/TRDRNA2_130308_c1_seq1.p1 gnl/TRDRNA2_/TRDRNA2_130308_c1~~gnl/TRDRNA2_/TRDRNA2_130308_c1_seq1.p1  ORF type:complete len:208 (+),score=13.61 gnl/TRDRNA2_/TRDRNA2_130308_c1_seq1:430-1053(+)
MTTTTHSRRYRTTTRMTTTSRWTSRRITPLSANTSMDSPGELWDRMHTKALEVCLDISCSIASTPAKKEVTSAASACLDLESANSVAQDELDWDRTYTRAMEVCRSLSRFMTSTATTTTIEIAAGSHRMSNYLPLRPVRLRYTPVRESSPDVWISDDDCDLCTESCDQLAGAPLNANIPGVALIGLFAGFGVTFLLLRLRCGSRSSD